MSSNYTGNPTATQSPAAAPSAGVAPIAVLPADGDARNAASIAQAFKVLCDYVAYLMQPLPIKAQLYISELWSRAHSAASSFTFSAGSPTTYVGQDINWQGYSSSGSNGSVSLATPTSQTFMAATLEQTSTSSGHRSFLASLLPVASMQNHATLFAETSFKWGGENANSETYFALHATPTVGAVDHGVGFYKTPSSSNWFAKTNDGTSTNTDTGVAVSGSFQHLRIELYGSSTAGGARALFYIDGSLVATHTTNIPAANDDLYVETMLKNTNATGAATTVVVGPVRVSLNRAA